MVRHLTKKEAISDAGKRVVSHGQDLCVYRGKGRAQWIIDDYIHFVLYGPDDTKFEIISFGK